MRETAHTQFYQDLQVLLWCLKWWCSDYQCSTILGRKLIRNDIPFLIPRRNVLFWLIQKVTEYFNFHYLFFGAPFRKCLCQKERLSMQVKRHAIKTTSKTLLHKRQQLFSFFQTPIIAPVSQEGCGLKVSCTVSYLTSNWLGSSFCLRLLRAHPSGNIYYRFWPYSFRQDQMPIPLFIDRWPVIVPLQASISLGCLACSPDRSCIVFPHDANSPPSVLLLGGSLEENLFRKERLESNRIG